MGYYSLGSLKYYWGMRTLPPLSIAGSIAHRSKANHRRAISQLLRSRHVNTSLPKGDAVVTKR